MTLFGVALNRPELIGTASAGRLVISMRRASTRALADQALADAQQFGMAGLAVVGVGREQLERSALPGR